MYKKNISECIKSLRKASGYTQELLSQKIGCSISAIKNIETGHRSPSLKLLIDIAIFFHVSLDYLVGIEKTKVSA
jgi:transcriptional regulator with XRE-family HTH domain